MRGDQKDVLGLEPWLGLILILLGIFSCVLSYDLSCVLHCVFSCVIQCSQVCRAQCGRRGGDQKEVWAPGAFNPITLQTNSFPELHCHALLFDALYSYKAVHCIVQCSVVLCTAMQGCALRNNLFRCWLNWSPTGQVKGEGGPSTSCTLCAHPAFKPVHCSPMHIRLVHVVHCAVHLKAHQCEPRITRRVSALKKDGKCWRLELRWLIVIDHLLSGSLTFPPFPLSHIPPPLLSLPTNCHQTLWPSSPAGQIMTTSCSWRPSVEFLKVEKLKFNFSSKVSLW